MKAVILARGLGTRISKEIHLKLMIEIGGKPILRNILKMYSPHDAYAFMHLMQMLQHRSPAFQAI